MNRIIHAIILLLILCASGGCRKLTDLEPQGVFVKLFPDSSYQTGGAFELSDGNYIIYGFDPDESGALPKVIKTDKHGDTIWQIKLSSLFHFLTIKPTLNGTMLAVGVVDGLSMNFCLIDADGNTTMLPSYFNSVRANANYLPDFVDDGNGEFSITSYFDSDKFFFPFVLRINQNGTPYKRYVIENSAMDATNFRPLGITHHVNGYAIAGTAFDQNHSFRGMFYVHLDDQYKMVWDTIMYDESATLSVDAVSENISDSSTIICGETGGTDFSGNLYVRKIDANDSMEGEILFPGDYENFGRFQHISQTPDDGYVLTGTVNLFADINLVSYTKIYVLKLDRDLNKEWSQQFGSKIPYGGTSASRTSDGGYIIGGLERPASYLFTMLLMKTDAEGNIVSE